jgi:hypothetical protein
VHLPLSGPRDGHRLGRVSQHETPQHRLAECPVQDGVGLLDAAPRDLCAGAPRTPPEQPVA